jgi:hypothetical protein
VQRTRIVLALPPHMLLVSDLIVGLLRDEESCEVMIDHGSDLFAAATSRDADVLITTTAAAAPSTVAALLEARPRLRAIAVEGDAREGVLYELYPHRAELRPLSRDNLLDALFRPRRPWFA